MSASTVWTELLPSIKPAGSQDDAARRASVRSGPETLSVAVDQTETLHSWEARTFVLNSSGALVAITPKVAPPEGCAVWIDIAAPHFDEHHAKASPAAIGEIRKHIEQLVARDPNITETDEEVADAAADLAAADRWSEVARYGDIHKLSVTWAALEHATNVGLDAKPNARPMIDCDRVEIAVGSNWMISCWHEIGPLTSRTNLTEASRSPAERLAANRAALQQAITDLARDYELSTAGDLAIAAVNAAVSSFSPSRKDLHRRLNDWEHNFYEVHFPVEGDTATKAPPNPEVRTLADLHSTGVDLARELDMLTAPRGRAAAHWVGAGRTSSRGAELAEVADERIDRTRRSMRDLGDRIRAALELAHSVTTARRADEERAHEKHSKERDARIAKIGAMFLAPTLVAGFFGINTKFPDAGTTRGTFDALALMAASAFAAWAVITWRERRDDNNKS